MMEKIQRGLQLGVKAYWEYKPLFTLKRVTTPLDQIRIDRPIFLLGVQGCGLTLLTRMIHRHPDVVTIGGGRRFWVGNNEMDKQYVRELPDDFTLRSPRFRSPVFKRHMTGSEYSHPIFGKHRNWVYACDDLVAAYRRTEKDWNLDKELQLRNAIKESIRAYSGDISRSRFLDMSQTFALKIPLLLKIFPDAKFVIQTRNPSAVCFKEAVDDRYGWRRRAGMAESLRLFSEHWYNTYRYAVDDLKGTSEALFIRYEDLINEPEDVLKRVTDAIDLPFINDMLPQRHHTLPLGSMEEHKWFPVREGINDKYLEEISRGEALIVERGVAEMAERFGYPRPS